MQLRTLYPNLKDLGVEAAVVMQSPPERMREELAGRYAVPYPALSDPERRAYAAYRLARATPAEVFAPRVIAAAGRTLLTGGHVVGRLSGDGWQMGGVFAVTPSGTLAAVRYPPDAGDNPDDAELLAMAKAAGGGD